MKEAVVHFLGSGCLFSEALVFCLSIYSSFSACSLLPLSPACLTVSCSVTADTSHTERLALTVVSAGHSSLAESHYKFLVMIAKLGSQMFAS